MSSTKTVRQRNPRGEGDRLRDEIVTAAGQLLEDTGSPEAVTLRAVARLVGIAAPSIYAHFADRDAMHEAVRNRTFEELIERVEAAVALIPEDEAERRLQAGCRAYLSLAADQPNRYAFLFLPRAKDVMDDDIVTGLRAFQILVDCVTAAAEQGQSASTDPWLDAANLWVAMHGYALLQANAPDFPWPDREAQLDRLIRNVGRLKSGGS